VDRSQCVSLSVGKSRRTAGACLAALVLLGGAKAAHPQAIVTPSHIDRTIFRANARSVAMGGAYLLVLDDASGAAFNPALIGKAGKYSLALEGGARTDNIDVNRVTRLIHGLDRLEEQIQAGAPGSVSAVRKAFDRIYRYAVDAGANTAGQRARQINAEVDPLVAFSYRNVGALVYGGVGASVGLGVGVGTGPDADKRTVSIGGGALDLTVIEVPYAFRLKAGQLGVGLKSVRGSYAGYVLNADASTDAITGANLAKSASRKVDLDLGYLSDPIPVGGLPGPGLQVAGVIRHLLSPSFAVPLEVRSIAGPTPDLPETAGFRLNPQVDIGAMLPYGRLVGVLELHNLSGTNAGDLTVHVGGEYRIAKFAALRLGYDADRFVGGVGFFAGPVRLDVAVATKPIERAYVGLSMRIP
jgi:hypothetical protein